MLHTALEDFVFGRKHLGPPARLVAHRVGTAPVPLAARVLRGHILRVEVRERKCPPKESKPLVDQTMIKLALGTCKSHRNNPAKIYSV